MVTHPHPRALEAAARALALKALASEMKARGYNDTHASEYADEWWPAHLDRARAAVTAYIAEAGDGWMPIETAPKDETRVMLWMEPMNDARFAPTDGPHAVFGTWVVWSDAMKREGMRDGWSWYGSPLHWPTHWMPLPAPPAAQDPRP